MRTWHRRLISFSVLFIALVLVIGFPVFLVAAMFHDVVSYRRWATTRTLLFLISLVLMESAGVVTSFLIWVGQVFFPNDELYAERNYRLQNWWGGRIATIGIRIYGLKLRIESAFHPEPNPFVLFIRHSSFADTFLPLVLVSSPSGIRLRYVMKQELLWDPCLDIVGNRIPNAFVRRTGDGSDADIELIRRLGLNLAENEGVVLYPEGTRFSPRMLQRDLARITRKKDRTSQLLAGLTSVLPPKFGGVLSLLENQQLDPVFCAHDGLQSARTLKQLLSGALIGSTVQIRLWRISRSDLPRDREALREWFAEEWLKVDRWVSERRAEEELV